MPDMSTLLPWLLAMGSGGLVALLLTVFGGGGSVLAVPLLLYVVGVTDPHIAIGVSAAGVALNALTALTGHARAGRVKWPCATVFAVFGALGAWAGSSLAKMLSGQHLMLAFAFAMLAVGVAMLRKTTRQGDGSIRLSPKLAPCLALTGAGIGSASGFFGIGGGFLIVPGLMAATGMTLAAAQASSLLSVASFGASTALNYALSGLISWPLVGAMAAGGVIGTVAGLPLAHKLASRAALGRRLFAALIVVTGLYVLVRTVYGL